MAEKDKGNYLFALIAMVAIVAIVAIVVMFMNRGEEAATITTTSEPELQKAYVVSGLTDEEYDMLSEVMEEENVVGKPMESGGGDPHCGRVTCFCYATSRKTPGCCKYNRACSSESACKGCGGYWGTPDYLY
ncbi:hypothetical protein KY348_00530 [Candidatus Woesearchaeota archaeon]|nr:hypothetical protein [Candidatus Woesearchaeota archaeon]